MPRLFVTVSALALLGSPAAIASAGPIIVGTVPPPASSAAAPATTASTPAATPAPAPAPAAAPEAKPVAAAPAAGAPVPPDMKNFPNTMDFLAANRTFRAQVAMAWAKGQIDAPTFRSLMATYRSNVQAGKVASAK